MNPLEEEEDRMSTANSHTGKSDELDSFLYPHEIIAEAARCLYCYDAPCARGCPSSVDVALFIRKIVTGNLWGAAKTLLDSNVLAGSCARVCPTEELCRGECVLARMGAQTIDIGRLQRFVMDRAMEREQPPIHLAPSSRARVSIIGAGPAGIACAVELRRLGHAAVVFDANQKPGGLATYAIAEYKIPHEFASDEIAWLARTGFSLKLGTRIGEHVTFQELEEISAAIFLALGLPVPSALAVPGEELPQVVDALPLIAAHRQGGALPVALEGKRVAVIGGGNTATDVAILARALGAKEVTIVYRRSRAEMPAYDAEIALAQERGVELLFLHSPTRIIGDQQVAGMECQPMILGEPDASGRRRPIPADLPIKNVDCGVVIRALGQRVDEKLVSSIGGVKVRKGLVKVDENSGQTDNPKYFAGGDCVNGGREVVHAAAEGMRAARAIHQLIAGKEA